MALEHLEGREYGPISLRISAAKVAEYVAATGDDAQRWVTAAPPAYAGALLFVVAPEFLASDAVAGHTAVLIHADQTFTWHAALEIGTDVDVVGRIERVRARGGVDFVSFSAAVTGSSGTPLLDSTSTFLLGAEPAGDPAPPHREPAVTDGAEWDPLTKPQAGRWNAMVRSASRLDLVRYAGASGDFNPIHFDHEAALGAGLAGVVVHGLLMGAWLLQPVAALRAGHAPLERAKLRFREPLYPGQAALLSGSVRDGGRDADVRLTEATEGSPLVTAQVRLAEA